MSIKKLRAVVVSRNIKLRTERNVKKKHYFNECNLLSVGTYTMYYQLLSILNESKTVENILVSNNNIS